MYENGSEQLRIAVNYRKWKKKKKVKAGKKEGEE